MITGASIFAVSYTHLMREFRERRIGRWEEILVEEVAELNGRRYLLGNTREYVRIAALLHENETAPVNALISGQVTGCLLYTSHHG